MENKKDVILVFAGEKENAPRLPMAILTIAAYIRRGGFNPILVDLRLGDWDHSKVDWDNVLCVGISSMSGKPLYTGINFVKLVQSINKGIPCVWGGPHASFFPEQTIRNEFVDFVIRNEGEHSFLEFLNQLLGDKEFSKVHGLTYISDGKVISSAEGDFEDMDNLPIPAYDLLDMDKYLKTGNSLSYEASRGCPYRCTFCYASFFHKHKWRSKSVAKIIQELKVIHEKYKPEEVQFIGDNLFVDKKAVMLLSEEFINEGFSFKWNTNARVDVLSRFSEEELKILRKSGCTHLWVGVESGSDNILRLIKKDITKEQVRMALRNCITADIKVMVSLMIGMPCEKKDDMYQTLDFYDEMVSSNSRMVQVNAISIYSPYPGTPMFEEACSKGYKAASSLEQWASWSADSPDEVMWYSKGFRKELDVISSISRFKYFVGVLRFCTKGYKKSKLGSRLVVLFYDLFSPLFIIDANIRWKYRFFSYAYEWKVFDIIRASLINAK